MNITGWQWIPAIIFGLVFFVVFSAVYGLWVYLRPPKIVSNVTPKDLGVKYEDVQLVTSDGVKLTAWYIPAKKETNKALLLLHGYPADKGDILSSMTFLQQDYNLLFLDFRYFGQSEGGYSTVGIKEVVDVLAAIEWLNNRGDTRIGVWGFSMGGATALMALEKTDKINAVVSETSYASLDLMAEEVFRQVPGLNKLIAKVMVDLANSILKVDVKKQSPLEAVSKTTVPILFIHSEEDEVIPFTQALLLKQASKHNPNAEFWFRKEGIHGGLGTGEYEEKIKEFFLKNF